MRITVGDGRLFFDVEGAKFVPEGSVMRERPTVLLLHGGPGFDHSFYKPEMSALSDVAQVVYLDHRSNGRSDRTASDRWTLEAWADDVRGFCDALEIEKPIVMGTSFGGFVAIAYATRYPDHPGKLILCSTSARWRLERVLDVFERLGGPKAREIARRYWEKPGRETVADYMRICLPLYTRTPMPAEKPARIRMRMDVAFAFARHEQHRFDLLAALPRIQCPTLVLAGEDDPITPIADSEDIAAAIPRELVRFERFSDTGHGVVSDAPQALGMIRDFICS